MKSVIIIVLILMAVSFLWSLFIGAIKWAIIIGVGFVVVGAIKAALGNSDSGGGA